MEKKDLKEYRELERRLRRIFKSFFCLCQACYSKSKKELERANKAGVICCCLLDDQVTSYWDSLNRAQTLVYGTRWAEQLVDSNSTKDDKKCLGRMSVCRGLKATGCTLGSHRPPSCNTLVCKLMVETLTRLKVVSCDINDKEIDEIIGAKSPFEYLFGMKKVTNNTKQNNLFLQKMTEFEEKIRLITPIQWEDAIRQTIINNLGEDDEII